MDNEIRRILEKAYRREALSDTEKAALAEYTLRTRLKVKHIEGTMETANRELEEAKREAGLLIGISMVNGVPLADPLALKTPTGFVQKR